MVNNNWNNAKLNNMNKEEFKNWLESETSFSNILKDGIVYEREVSYDLCINDYIYVYDDYVTFCWNELYFGGCNYNTGDFKFEEFIYNYENKCF